MFWIDICEDALDVLPCGVLDTPDLQGYLTCKKTHPPRTLPWAYA